MDLLLWGAGYEIIDEEKTYPDQIVLIARKTNAKKRAEKKRPTYSVEKEVEGFIHAMRPLEMRASTRYRPMRYRLQWRTKNPTAEYIPAPSWRIVDQLLKQNEQVYDFFATRILKKFTNRRSCVVSGLARRYTYHQDSPIEIQFNGDIELLVR